MTAAIALRSIIAAVFALLLFLGIITIPLAPLPLFYIGLTASPGGLLLAGVLYALLAATLIGWPLAITTLLLFTFPAFALTRLSLLSRIRGDAETAASQAPQKNYEFYPADKLVLWICGMAVVLTSLMFGRFAYEDGGLPAVFISLLTNEPSTAALLGLNELGLESSALEMVVATMLVTAGASWAISLIATMLLAQRLAEWTKLNLRPQQTYDDLTLPSYLDALLVGSIILSFFLDGAWSIYFAALALCFLIPYFLLGLSVIHAISRPLDARVWILSALYLFLLLFLWLGILVALLGLIEPLVRLRQRMGTPKMAQKQPKTRSDDTDPPEKE
jgi:hypothetical protein